MTHLVRLNMPIANRRGCFYPGALHLAHVTPPGLEGRSLDECPRKRAAYYEALGAKEAFRYVDEDERAFYGSGSDSEDSDTTT